MFFAISLIHPHLPAPAMDSSGEEETAVRSVEKKAKKSKKHKKHKKSSKSEHPEKRSKSSKKKRRHSNEPPSDAEEGHRSHKVKKTADSKAAKVVPESLQNVAQATSKRVTVVAAAPTVSTAAVSPKKKRPSDAAEASVHQVKRDRKSSSGSEKNPQSHNHQPHIVTTKSNGQSKLLTHPKSSKLGGGIPTDPSKLVEILTKAAPEPTTEILSSDSEANDR